MAELIGEEHQFAPKLVLGGGVQQVPGVEMAEARGRRFVAGAVPILRYLAATRHTPIPH